jgi:hypothetical protein
MQKSMLCGSRSFMPILVFLVGSAPALFAQDFKLAPGCTLPFADIAPSDDPFQSCGNCGVASVKASPAQVSAKAYESQAKNNFCADASVVTVVDFSVLRAMQAQRVDKSQLSDRHVLHGLFQMPNGKTIGEGDVVRLKAWILDAHVSDCPAGESVNCSKSGFANNDLHIPLLDPTVGDGRNQDECTSVTAEISPHFRPAAWSDLDMKTPVKNVVRVTGPLFFDNSHQPCKTTNHTEPGNAAPFRSSLWEIHPVYGLEVCANAEPGECDVNSKSAEEWIPYDKWVTRPDSLTQPTGKKQRSGCHPSAGGATKPIKCPASLTSD